MFWDFGGEQGAADACKRQTITEKHVKTNIQNEIHFVACGLTMAILRTNNGFPPPLFSCKITSEPSGNRSASGCAAMTAFPIMCFASTRQSEGDSGDISMVVPISRNVVKS